MVFRGSSKVAISMFKCLVISDTAKPENKGGLKGEAIKKKRASHP